MEPDLTYGSACKAKHTEFANTECGYGLARKCKPRVYESGTDLNGSEEKRISGLCMSSSEPPYTEALVETGPGLCYYGSV